MLKDKTQSKQQKNHSLNALQNAVCTFFNTPQQSKYCLCNICLQNYELRQKGKQFLRQSSSMFKVDMSRMRKFYQFISSVDQKIYFKMQIPEICFFQAGQAKWLFRTKGNGVSQIIITPQLKKQVPNFFLDSKKIINGPQSFAETELNHIKYFQSICPSFKHGLSNDNLDNKPKNYTFHSNQKQSEDNQVYRSHINAAAEVAMVKYKDSPLELVNEKHLRGLFKSVAKSQSIQLIQSYIKPHEKQSEFIFSEYLQYRKPQNVLMYNRSLVQMKIEIGLLSKFSKDYIPLEYLEQYEQMLKEMPQEYCLYETYKMIHFIEINRNVRIGSLVTVWFKDECKEITFFGIVQFEYEENEKLTADVPTVVELKDLMKNELTDLEKELLNVWQNMKKRKSKDVSKVHNDQDDLLKEIDMIKKVSQSRKKSQILPNSMISHQK